ncbi:erythromycin esterase family protein [Rhodocytophaga aerolata]|uniref:Erythromycin esterase family protein n=1 Tax=Rhodocytophaga aerolata TaxID=455078 RepID=A0ABT8RIA3_9BACT|nr:erythromycin esterase family protein [Rhodocytophaga aerolata]MDO1451699.1 erythromycin esterase family protein [Rhodocytophaga aerolata]
MSRSLLVCYFFFQLLCLHNIFFEVYSQPKSDALAWIELDMVSLSEGPWSSGQTKDYFDQALLGKQIIALGEQNHGDGSTFTQFSRLVKLLHEQYGFEAIVFESGFYDCHKAWQQIKAGRDPLQAFEKSVFSIWSQSQQAAPLFDYIAHKAHTPTPLLLSGFDSQFTGSYGREEFIGELDSLLKIIDASYALTKEYQAFRDMAQKIAHYKLPYTNPSVEEQDLFHRELAHLVSLVESSSLTEKAFYVQLMHNLALHAQSLWSMEKLYKGELATRELLNLRDVQMAKNVIWLLEGPLQGKKIILWGNISHLLKNSSSLVAKSGRDLFKGATTMGDYLYERYGEKMYVIASLSYEGQTGHVKMDPKQKVPAAPEGSLNALLHQTGKKLAFLDLNKIAPQKRWLTKPMLARLDHTILFEADWTKVFDGIFYIDQMQPSWGKQERSREKKN